ncbi:MAG: hypothetical protein ABH818_01840 [Patescibacteria group bacterium]|nr:hypothetical protein [Patescibacteria group bacterium]
MDNIFIKKLNFGLWYVTHLKQLRLAVIIFLNIASAACWVYTIHGFAYYIMYGMKEDEVIVKEMINSKTIDHSYLMQLGAKDLILYPVTVLSSIDKKNDFVVQIKNVNPKIWARFDYYFLIGTQKTKKQSGFIFPNEIKYFLALAQESLTDSTNAQLVIENLKWQRINSHKISDWPSYYNAHLNITSTDAKFISASQSELSQELSLNQLSCYTNNKTVFNYWKVDYSILLFSNNTVIHVNKYTLMDFMSGQTRLIELSLLGNIKHVDKVEVIPEINIMDDDIYIKYKGEVRPRQDNN